MNGVAEDGGNAARDEGRRSRRAPSPKFQILLVEDNPADAGLIQESFADGTTPVALDVVATGEDAIAYLTRPDRPPHGGYPQLILLDLKLPGLDGRQVLAGIKDNDRCRHIPVVILSSSNAEHDVWDAYAFGASCYLSKPMDYEAYRDMVRAIEHFWLNLARLPVRPYVANPVR